MHRRKPDFTNPSLPTNLHTRQARIRRFLDPVGNRPELLGSKPQTHQKRQSSATAAPWRTTDQRFENRKNHKAKSPPKKPHSQRRLLPDGQQTNALRTKKKTTKPQNHKLPQKNLLKTPPHKSQNQTKISFLGNEGRHSPKGCVGTLSRKFNLDAVESGQRQVAANRT
jgi:hypothetical protein